MTIRTHTDPSADCVCDLCGEEARAIPGTLHRRCALTKKDISSGETLFMSVRKDRHVEKHARGTWRQK